MVLELIAAATLASGLTPQQKAALVVVSGLPAPPGVGGVIVRRWDRDRPRPRGALVFADQEGGAVRAFPSLPPFRPAGSLSTTGSAFAAGRATGRALRRVGVHVDLAPLLDLADGPLGSRHFRRPGLGVAFARGLESRGAGACAKHFPGLGSASISTDERPHVDARLRAKEVAAFRAAIRSGVPCVMTSHAFYDGAPFRASIEPRTYRLLRSLGFEGVAITDSLSIVRAAPVEHWSRRAIRAGADLLLFTSPSHARRAIRALLPLARAGELDAHVQRVARFRTRFGIGLRRRGAQRGPTAQASFRDGFSTTRYRLP
jgi:beta-N-acetylhexosaminidase